LFKDQLITAGKVSRGYLGVAKPQFIFLMLFTSTGTVFSLVQFVAFFGPLVD
jgi:hypothetical protein